MSLTGLVDDVRTEISRSWVSLVPMHTGGGTRLKILEAMALGTPVVATSKGAEGLHVQHGREILIADDPMSFTEAVCLILENPELRSSLASNALKLLQEQYDFQAIMPQFMQIVNGIDDSKLGNPKVA